MKLPNLHAQSSLKFAVAAFVVGIIGVAVFKGTKDKAFSAKVNRSLYANTIHFPELITRAGMRVPAWLPNDPDVTWTLPDLVDPKHDNILYNRVPYQGMQSAPVPPNFERMNMIGSIDKYNPGRYTYF